MSRQGYLSDSEVLGRCVAMQSVPLGRPDLAVRIGSKTVYPQNAQMMYSNLRFDRETKLNLISDFVDRSRAQPQPVPPGIPPAPAAIPPAPAAIPPIPPDTLMGLGEEDGSDSDSGDTPLQSSSILAPASLHYDSDSDSSDTALRSLPYSSSSILYEPGDSPTGRERDELSRHGRNILLDRINSAFAGSVRSRESGGFATLSDVNGSSVPSSAPARGLNLT